MDDPKKQARIDEVKALLVEFSKQHLASAPDVVSYIEKLWDQIGRKRSYVITGGTKEVWASAVVYVIARLNFLFDKARPNYLTADTICGHFGTKKGDRKSTRLNSSHSQISYAVFCLKKKKTK